MRLTNFKSEGVKSQTKGALSILSVSDLRDRLNIRENDKDTMLGELIDASYAWAEEFAGSLSQDIYKEYFKPREFADYTDYHEKSESFVGRLRLILSQAPLISVESVKYYGSDTAETEYTISTDDYSVLDGDVYFGKDYSFTNLRDYQPLEVNYTAGLASVPSYVKDILARYCMRHYDEYVADKNRSIDDDYRISQGQIRQDEAMLRRLQNGRCWL